MNTRVVILNARGKSVKVRAANRKWHDGRKARRSGGRRGAIATGRKAMALGDRTGRKATECEVTHKINGPQAPSKKERGGDQNSFRSAPRPQWNNLILVFVKIGLWL